MLAVVAVVVRYGGEPLDIEYVNHSSCNALTGAQVYCAICDWINFVALAQVVRVAYLDFHFAKQHAKIK